MVILLHSSKTMRRSPAEGLRPPQLVGKAKELASYLATLSEPEIMRAMKVSAPLAAKTHGMLAAWNTNVGEQSAAIDSFVGDIYSGVRADSLTPADRAYADGHLRILSGLYGILRPLDGIMPYRLEMGYRLPDSRFASLYDFWGDAIARTLPADGPIINVSAVEYTRAVLPYVDVARVVTPKFLTVDQKSGEPTFVVVHAKIARGAFARWLIKNRIDDVAHLAAFADIGYTYDAGLSTPAEPVFVAQEFAGKGLSMRLL